MKSLIFLATILYLPLLSPAQSKEVPFTLEDRDRIIRVEERLNSLEKSMNVKFNAMDARFKAMDAQFDAMRTRFAAMEVQFETQGVIFESLQVQLNSLQTIFFWFTGIMVTLIVFILGFIIWDRRTAVAPIREKTAILDTEYQRIALILKEYSKDKTKLAEILRAHGLL